MALKNTWFNRTFRPGRMAQEDISQATEDVRSGITGMTRYDIPQEVFDTLQLLQGAGEAIRGTTALAQEATDIARAGTGVSEMPGEALARRDIQQSAARTTQSILEAGGGGASTLGAIAQAGLGEQSAFGQLAAQRAQYRSGREQALMNALQAEAGMTAQAEAQAAQLESAGLSQLAQQRQQQFEYGREQELTGLQFDIDQLASMRAEEAARAERRSNMMGSILSTVGTIGGAVLGGPLGATIGSKLGNVVGGGVSSSAPNNPSYYNQTKGV